MQGRSWPARADGAGELPRGAGESSTPQSGVAPVRRATGASASAYPPPHRGSPDGMQANDITRERLRRLAATQPAHGKVLSLFFNLDPREFATPPARGTEMRS